jgi:hypothetical protein
MILISLPKSSPFDLCWNSLGTSFDCRELAKKPRTLREQDMLSAEERALALQIADRLISLYEERDVALADGDLDRIHEIQDRINEIAAQRQEILASVAG